MKKDIKKQSRTFLFLCGLSFGLLSINTVLGRELIRDRTFTQKEERINGKLFAHKRDVINGVKTEEWQIDGKLVDKDAFTSAFSEAEQEELRLEQEKLDAAIEQEQRFKNEAREAAERKLLAELLAASEQELTRIRSYNLHKFFVFSPDSFDSLAAYERLVNTVIPAAKAVTEGKSPDTVSQDFTNAQDVYRELEPAISRLKKLTQDAIKQAIEKARDTKTLKELLKLVA